ncbi:MAG: phosphonate metabolism protein/1,5-bisphosphokinase (PRPP-forming) PhnN [Polaromonas sp.]
MSAGRAHAGFTGGGWVFVCGPSGSGKDSVIAAARQLLGGRSDIVFSRRVVTRAVHTESEHDAVEESVFGELVLSGELCWHWQAHGFGYGIARHYADDVSRGRLVVVNGSRAHVTGLPSSPHVRVVQIAAEPDQLARRLALRGRDTTAAVAERLARNSHFANMQAELVIVNDGELAAAGQRLADYLDSAVTPMGVACDATHLALSRTDR